ncbi:MAG: hypothetical protein OEV08_14140, partial [Nitrospira sp.]|nr:hypothetical protein [Nitrospira sp.]
RMDPIKVLDHPDYSESERQALIDFVLAFKKAHIQDFLAGVRLKRSGTKSELRDRIQDGLDEGELTYEQLVGFLDSVSPWGKQHVFLYAGPHGDLQLWKDPAYVLEKMKENDQGELFNAKLPLILPEELTLSSITHDGGRLRVTAVQKREYTERTPDLDEERHLLDGETISLRAYVHHQSRTIVAFEWNIEANTAMLQITQLLGDAHYSQVAEKFFALVSGWLDIKLFSDVDIRKAIRRLHELEGQGKAEARSHNIDYRTLLGRRLSAHSASPNDSVLGEAVIDQAMENVAKHGVAHLGNFYWLEGTKPGPVPNPLDGNVHVVIVGDMGRINFPTPNSEEVVRYVLRRVRALSGTTS